LPLDVAGLAADPAQIFETIVRRFQLVVADAPILDREIRIEECLAVARLDVAAIDEVGNLETPGRAVPMHHRSAEPGAREKPAQAPQWQRALVAPIAERVGLPRGIDHQPVANAETQFVVHSRRLEVRHGVARRPALDADDLEAGGGEFLGEDRRRHADADRNHIDRLEAFGHRQGTLVGIFGSTCT
jgi:hypothetical protein